MPPNEHTGWPVIAVAIPYVLLALTVTDALRVPWEYLSFDVIAVQAVTAFGALWPFCLVQLCIAAIAYGIEHRPSQAVAGTVGIGVAVLVMAITSHRILVQYHRFEGDPPMLIAWAGFAVALFAAYTLAIFRPGPRWLRVSLGIASLGAGLAFWWATTVFYRYRYPALHRSAVAMTFLMWHGAVVCLASCAPLLRDRRGRPIVAVAATAALAATAVAIAPTDLRGATYVKEFTGLGQGGVLDLAHPPLDGCSHPGIAMDEARAMTVFERRSGLPALPPGWSLDDYNVVLVSAEAIRADASFVAGAPDVTPNLSALARAGAFGFRRAYAPSTGTILTAAGVVAMTYPSHAHVVTKMPAWSGELMADELTIGEAFAAAGYETFAYVHGLEMGVTLLGFGQGIADYHVEPSLPDAKAQVDIANTDRAIAAIARARGAGDRFFGWVFYVSAHYPYEGRGLPPDADRKQRYLADVRHADEQFGRIVDHLRRTGGIDDTVVIFFGDHGEELGEHGRQSRHGGTVHEVIAHVPLLVHIPGVHGAMVGDTTSLTYLFPWLMSHGDGPMRELAVRRIREHIAPMMVATDGAAVVELANRDWMRTALIWDRYKVSYNFYSGLHQVFDLATDPNERVDLFGVADPKWVRYMSAYRALRACRWRIDMTDQPIEDYLGVSGNPVEQRAQ